MLENLLSVTTATAAYRFAQYMSGTIIVPTLSIHISLTYFAK